MEQRVSVQLISMGVTCKCNRLASLPTARSDVATRDHTTSGASATNLMMICTVRTHAVLINQVCVTFALTVCL